MSPQSALREHWPEYLIEAWALGCFMVSAGVFASLLGSPVSPIYSLVPSTTARTVLVGLAMGVTAVLLIHSPWGKRSGAHMNPAVTLTFLRLGKVHRWDALFFVIAQVAGGTLGVVMAASILGSVFTDPPVSYAATLPGPRGVAVAFVAETASPSDSWRQCSCFRRRPVWPASPGSRPAAWWLSTSAWSRRFRE